MEPKTIRLETQYIEKINYDCVCNKCEKPQNTAYKFICKSDIIKENGDPFILIDIELCGDCYKNLNIIKSKSKQIQNKDIEKYGWGVRCSVDKHRQLWLGKTTSGVRLFEIFPKLIERIEKKLIQEKYFGAFWINPDGKILTLVGETKDDYRRMII